ncbi:hypothetical protein ACFQGA_09560 [Marinobacter koreensis]|uniref:Prophage minor tail protein Z (GPZ) n=1 Tax=Marinobacter koreensis TaxID=335974 RepID=A0ABW0RHY0_9GAMM|nr:hypothetical protein [Marinobacter koreensis]MCK7547191.1 hypothetical protein [Marinobacter koreensis]
MPRRQPRIQMDLDKLAEFARQTEQMPQSIRRATRRSLNDQARDAKRELAQQISKDGISRAKAGGQIELRRASNKKPEAVLRPTSRRIPFRYWKTTTKTTDSSGTRASVWIRKDGQLMRVWGFVNPKSKNRRILTRHRKAGQDRIKPAAGHSIKLHFQAAADERYRSRVGEDLRSRFIKYFNEELKK